MLILYGIPNCDTCRKARRWLERHAILYRFHDVRADGIDRDTLRRWTARNEWKQILNTRSSTWRRLPERDRGGVDKRKAIELMLEHPTLIKRPVAESGDRVIVGFSEDHYRGLGARAGAEPDTG